MAALFAFLPLWGTVLVGAAAVAVPILIHLFNRKRYRVVVWAAMKFLLAAQKQNTRRMRIEQLILLAVRCLLLLLLVLALASIEPWAETVWAGLWSGGSSPGHLRTGRIHKVLVIDASLSMAAKHEQGKSCFDLAREQALKIIGDAGSGDGFSVLVLGERLDWKIQEASLDCDRVSKEINGLKVTHGNTSALAALQAVADRLRDTDPRFTAREVYFLTDLQRATWNVTLPTEGQEARAAKDQHPLVEELQKAASTVFVDVGRDGLQNVAVTDLTVSDPILTAGAEVAFQATIKNFGSAARNGLGVELLIGRGSTAAGGGGFDLTRHDAPKKISLRSGETATVVFTHRFTSAGTYAVRVQVDRDDLEADDARTVIVTVREQIPLLLVNGQPADPKHGHPEAATEVLPFALDPPPIGKDGVKVPVQLTELSVGDFARENLSRFDCIFLCDVGELTPNDVNRLAAHLRRGGGLVVTAGDNVADNIDLYNKLLFNQKKGLLPARLVGVQEAPAGNHFYLDADDSHFKKPPLRAFLDATDRFTLRRAQFFKYLRVTPSAGPGSQVLMFRATGPQAANLPDADPALLAWHPPLPVEDAPAVAGKGGAAATLSGQYRGKVIFLTTTVNRDWTTWPGSASFLPMMQQLWRLGVSARLRDQALPVGAALEEVVGSVEGHLRAVAALPKEEAAKATLPEATLFLPGGDTVQVPTQNVEDLLLFRWAKTDQAGVYRVTVGKAPTDYLFAVNPPPTTLDTGSSESDPERLDRERLKEIFSGWDFQLVKNPADARPPQNTQGSEAVWPVRHGPWVAFRLLLAVLGLMLLEVVLACAFARFSVVPGIKQIPRLRLLWPGVTAVLAVLLIGVVAGTLLQAAATNDFLSFLPDETRGLVESVLGIQSPAPGESRLWELQSSPDSAMPSWMWFGLGLLGVVIAGVYVLEARAVGVPVGGLLGLANVALFLTVLVTFLPQWELQFVRESWPDVVLIIDDSLSMGEPDYYNETIQAKVDEYTADIRKQLEEQLPGRIRSTRERLEELRKNPPKGQEGLVRETERRLEYYEKLLPNVKSPSWRPTRLQAGPAHPDTQRAGLAEHAVQAAQAEGPRFPSGRAGPPDAAEGFQGLRRRFDRRGQAGGGGAHPAGHCGPGAGRRGQPAGRGAAAGAQPLRRHAGRGHHLLH